MTRGQGEGKGAVREGVCNVLLFYKGGEPLSCERPALKKVRENDLVRIPRSGAIKLNLYGNTFCNGWAAGAACFKCPMQNASQEYRDASCFREFQRCFVYLYCVQKRDR